MEDEVKPDIDLRGSSLERINRILNALDILDITTPGDLQSKFNLYRRLINNTFKYMKPEEKVEAENMLNTLKIELGKWRNKNASHFTYYADIFERNIQSFVHNRIKEED